MELSIAAFLMMWLACELLPTRLQQMRARESTLIGSRCGKQRSSSRLCLVAEATTTITSTVLAQDHFYSDFLGLSLTLLTHKGSLMITCDC